MVKERCGKYAGTACAKIVVYVSQPIDGSNLSKYMSMVIQLE
jgi:hypothetical protein